MQVVAVSTRSHPDWRWRIVTYAGEVVEESNETFPSIAVAVREGGRRLHEIDVPDQSARAPSYYRSTSYRRSR